MQCLQVIYHGMSHESLEFSQYKHKPSGECVYQENTSDKWDMPWYTTRDCCITILYHAIENTVANVINATYAWHMMRRLNVIPLNIQQLPCILIGCTFYCMV